MLNRLVGIPLLLSFALIATGCTSLTHYNKQRVAKDNNAFFVDAKQRGVYSVKKTETAGGTTWEGVCAEPAPDAISSLAATLGVDLKLTDKGQVGVSQSISEATSSIGVRTAAIEALRDIMYRNCEAYALGGVSNIGIETLQRRFQSTMVAILAIEQLTGAVRAPSIILTGSSSAGDADAIVDLTNKVEVARKSLEDANAAETISKGKYETATAARVATDTKLAADKDEAERIEGLATPTEAEQKTLADYKALTTTLVSQKEAEASTKKEFEEAQSTTKARSQAYNALESARVAALTSGGNTNTAGEFQQQASRPALSDAAAKHVSDAVVKIVKNATSELRFSDELCTTLLGQFANDTPAPDSALETCIDRLASGQMLVAQAEQMEEE